MRWREFGWVEPRAASSWDEGTMKLLGNSRGLGEKETLHFSDRQGMRHKASG